MSLINSSVIIYFTLGRKCLKWTKDRKVNENGNVVTIQRFSTENFPDEDIKNVGKTCRNPNSNIGGPWCFTTNPVTSAVEPEFCDIPFCDEADCMFYADSPKIYTHYSSFGVETENLTFSVKLWDPDEYFKAKVRLVLTTLALPLTEEEIDNTGAGIEIYLSNDYSALSRGNADSVIDKIKTTGILRATKFTTFHLTWHKGFIELFTEGRDKSLFLMEYKNNLVGLKFKYYSVGGSKALWSFPFCVMDNVCDVHTTTAHLFTQFNQLRITETGILIAVQIF